MEIKNRHLALIVVALSIVALWYYGRECPIEIRYRKVPDQNTLCSQCYGCGSITCARCGGFGSLASQSVCPTCKGTGKHKWRFGDKPDALCPKCRGSCHAEARMPCEYCSKTGRILCSSCNGTGRESRMIRTVNMGFSRWEKFKQYLRIPIDYNPCPQITSEGKYLIVEEYVRLKSRIRASRVANWGKFQKRGEEWAMTAGVEFLANNEVHSIKHIEFIVQDRELKAARTVK